MEKTGEKNLLEHQGATEASWYIGTGPMSDGETSALITAGVDGVQPPHVKTASAGDAMR